MTQVVVVGGQNIQDGITRYFLGGDDLTRYRESGVFDCLLDKNINGVHVKCERHQARQREFLLHCCCMNEALNLVYMIEGTDSVDMGMLVNMIYIDYQQYLIQARNDDITSSLH